LAARSRQSIHLIGSTILLYAATSAPPRAEDGRGSRHRLVSWWTGYELDVLVDGDGLPIRIGVSACQSPDLQRLVGIQLYRLNNLVERFLSTLKHFRRIATR
jgi:transposase